MKDDLQVLIAQLRARGGRVSTNVVAGHNVTAPDGTERRFHSTRQTYRGQATPNRDTLRQHIRSLLND